MGSKNPPPGDEAAADQGQAIDFLASPAAYGPKVREVARIDTHAAIVFLAGDAAYKIKRAVRFPFLDFSTLEKRRQVCERELAINRRTAPELYLDVVAITREADGGLAFGGKGEVVEWAVHMRRFDQDALFDQMAKAGRLTPELMRATADVIRAFHDKAERLKGTKAVGGGAKAVHSVIAENLDALKGRPDLFPPAAVEDLRNRMEGTFAKVSESLDRRVEEGKVRLCHGDLHLRNLCLIEGRPTLFDAIEFNDAFAAIDVLDDLAFLLMDLDHRDMRPFGNLVFNRYFADEEDFLGLRALPLFLASRAMVRAKVCAISETKQTAAKAKTALCEEAGAYLKEALGYLEARPARLIGIGGLSGTGKTSVARALAPEIGAAPGALHLRSDTLRKQLFGAAETERLGPSAYKPEVSRRVYDALGRRAKSALGAGHSVLIDAVSARPEDRTALEALAETCGVRFLGIWLEAQAETLLQRVGGRTGDASDATPEVVRQQLTVETGRVFWHRVSADGPLAKITAAARALL